MGSLCDYLLQDEEFIFCQCKFPCAYQNFVQQLHVPVNYDITEILLSFPNCGYYEVES